MTQDEFQRWFRHHAANFTGLVAWLGKIPKTADPGMPNQLDVTTAWYRQLAFLDINLAIAASDELASSPEQFQPRSFDRHPAAMLAIAKRLRRDQTPEHRGPHYVDGHETFKCAICQDKGTVEIWHWKTITLTQRGQLKATVAECARAFQWYTNTAQCSCEAGKAGRWLGIIYNPETMLIVKPCQPHEEQLAEVKVFVATLDERRLAAKCHPEFNSFSGVSGRDRAAGED